MALDKLVGQIIRLSANPNNWLQLQEVLKAEEKQLERQKNHIPGALNNLQEFAHSYGYMFLL